MKISIETIGDKQCTVIRKPFDAEWVKEQLSMGIPVVAACDWREGNYYIADFLGDKFYYLNENGSIDTANANCWTWTLTILPPLPRNPTPEDAPLLYRYMAEGLEICGSSGRDALGCRHQTTGGIYLLMSTLLEGNVRVTITHAIHNGERVEIAIGDDDD